ncbi:MAG: class I SAM-dependent methyltransferase [Mucilaginibacter polytrichastri]|nr:class I SAM-dependent methyltransferase [Mucilaginibacter polytrichastri]
MHKDVFGEALSDFYEKKSREKLWLHNSYGEPEEMPVSVFFRPEKDMPDLEQYALDLCRGTILDIGAGVGSHALALQKNFDVTALEINPQACAIMKKRGVKKALCDDVFDYTGERFETLLMLMNGIGLCGNIEGFRRFLAHARNLLLPGGQLLFDSSDITYLYEDLPKPANRYFGEIAYRYEYRKHSGEWFNWLYLDQEMLFSLLKTERWDGQVIYEDDNAQYLARIWPLH